MLVQRVANAGFKSVVAWKMRNVAELRDPRRNETSEKSCADCSPTGDHEEVAVSKPPLALGVVLHLCLRSWLIEDFSMSKWYVSTPTETPMPCHAVP